MLEGAGISQRFGGLAALTDVSFRAFTEIRWISLQTERRHYPFDR